MIYDHNDERILEIEDLLELEEIVSLHAYDVAPLPGGKRSVNLNSLATGDIDLVFDVEATYWTKRILGEYPEDSSYEMRELVDSLIANQMEVAA